MKEKSKFDYFERLINLLNALDGSVVNPRFTYNSKRPHYSIGLQTPNACP